MSDLEKFTEFLFGDAVGYAYAPIKTKENEWNQNFFQWPGQKEVLHNFIRTASLDGDVYLAPSLFSEKSSKKSAIKSTSVVWVEFDGKVGIQFKDIAEPDVIVQSSSSTHLHCYWKIPPVGVESVEDINRRLTYYLDADSSGWDANQVLRPPETTNWKTSSGRPVHLSKYAPDIHTFSIFDSAPKVSLKIAEVSYDSLLDPLKIKLPVELYNLVHKQVPLEPKLRSTFLMSTGHLLAGQGLSQEEIVSLLYVVDCRVKKFVGRGDQLVRLSEIAAIALFKATPIFESYSPLEIINHAIRLDWIIPKWLHTTGMMFLSGAPGVGKTQLSFDMAYHLATGQSFLEKKESPAIRVLYLSLEMDILELQYIFALQGETFSSNTLWEKNLKIASFEEATFSSYEKSIQDHKPQVVFIDSLSELSEDDLTEREAKRIMKWIRSTRKKYSVAFVVIHHNRKAGEGNKKPNKLSDLYGSFIFAAKSETVLSLWKPEDKDYLELGVLKARFDKNESIRLARSEHLTFKKTEVTSVTVTRDNPLVPSFIEFK